MKKAFILFFTSALLTGCSSTDQLVKVVERSTHDTLCHNKILYDSIFIDNLHYIDRSRDTILIRDKTIEYRYKYLQDTSYIHQIDTIPVIKTIEVVKTKRYVPSIYKYALGIVIILLILAVGKITLKFVKL